MVEDFYPFVDSGDPAPDNAHITGEPGDSVSDLDGSIPAAGTAPSAEPAADTVENTVFATRISIYDDMFSTPRVLIVQPNDPRTYLEEVTNTVYRVMKEQGGALPLMIIRELVENFIHAHFTEPIVSVLDGGNTIRFADLGPGISDKERAFEFGVTSADRSMKRYIRGTGAGLPMVQQYLENAGGAVSIEDNLGCGTVVTVSVDAARVQEIERHANRGAAVRGSSFTSEQVAAPAPSPYIQQVPAQLAPAQPYQPVPQAAPYGYQPAPNVYPYHPATESWPTWQGYPPAGAPMPGAAYPGAGQQMPTGYTAAPHSPGYPAAPSAPGYPAVPITPAEPLVEERGRSALSYIQEHGQAGPTDLSAAFGSSVPTWSRELATLSSYGFLEKHGRKYLLTQNGAAWLANHQ